MLANKNIVNEIPENILIFSSLGVTIYLLLNFYEKESCFAKNNTVYKEKRRHAYRGASCRYNILYSAARQKISRLFRPQDARMSFFGARRRFGSQKYPFLLHLS